MSPQVVLQTMQRSGQYRCVTFVDHHRAVHPRQFVVAPGDLTSVAATLCEDLGDHLQRELVNLCGSPPPAPCGGTTPAPPSCSFTMQGQLLILVGDGSSTMQAPAWAAGWKTLSVLPNSVQNQAAALLPAPLSALQASFWEHSIREVVADGLTTGGVTPERPRIFISYKRSETQGLANQLFHALAAAQFDVFLDHYRIPAGVELLGRIRQELAEKTMVLLLESAQLLASRWTRLEVRTAQALRLGLFGITLPGGGGRDWLPDDTMPRLVETQNPLAMICLGGVGRVAIQAHLFREYGRGRPIFVIASTGGDARALADNGVAIAEDRNLMLELGPLRENADLSEEREPLGGAQQRDEAAIVPFSLLMQRLVDRLAPPQ